MLSIISLIFYRTLSNAIPLTLGTLGESLTEKSGNLNLGVEGMMSIGAIAAYGMYFHTTSALLGIIMAVVCGILISLVHGFATISLRANQTISGLAITMLGVGLSTLIGKGFLGKTLPLPEGKYEAGSDILSFLNLTNSWVNMEVLLVITLLLVVGIHILVKHTRIGISLRSVGENPKASLAQGISVNKMRYLGVTLGGALSGLAGGFLALVEGSSWQGNPIRGRGWIVIALTVFSQWKPLMAIISGLLFALVFTLQFQLQDYMPVGLIEGLPYFVTMAVLVIKAILDQRKKEGKRRGPPETPSSLGVPFDPEER
jgi:ABC-type uncharacterized transport system permease subunit